MKILIFGNLTFLFFFTFISTYSQNSLKNNEIKTHVLLQLKLSNSDIKDELYVEKTLPYDQSVVAVVVPKISRREFDEYNNETFCELDSYILLVDHSTGNILSKFYEPSAWNSDAVFISSIAIDTAPYILNLNTRAFGVEVHYEGSSRANPSNQTYLDLFAPNQQKLDRILNSLSTALYYGEWDTKCEGEFDYEKSVIVVDKKESNGFNDLIIKQTKSKFKNQLVADDCVEKIIKESKHKKRMKYNGVEYK